MDFSLSELNNFLRVAEEGNISNAARIQGLTQPALSMSIKRMEDVLGIPLFHRHKRGVSLTRAGETLKVRARELLRGWERLRDAIEADESETRGIYTLGVHSTIATYTLPMFYHSLLSEYPYVELHLVHDLSRNIAEGVIHYKTDFGIVVDPPNHHDLEIIPLYHDEFMFWVGENPTALSDCTQPNSLVAANPRLLRTATLMREARRSGLVHGEARILHTTELELIANLASRGQAVGVLPATIALGRKSRPLVPLKGTPIFEDEVCLIYRRDMAMSTAFEVIREHIVNHLKGENPKRGK